jgi:very-short-patch-repair endonuclease
MGDWAKVVALAETQRGCFTTAEASKLGIYRMQLKRAVEAGHCRRVLPRTYAMPEADRFLPACLWSGGVLSHRAAALQWRFEGFDAAKLEVTAPKRIAHRNVIVHQRPMPEGHWLKIDGLKLTSRMRTLADLGAVCDFQTLLTAFDHQWREGHVTPAELELFTGRQWGSRLIDAVIADAKLRQRAMESLWEVRFWCLLRRKKFPLPEVQVQLGKRRVDFFWRSRKLIVEIDGWESHASTTRKDAATKQRAKQLELEGYDAKAIAPCELRDDEATVVAWLKAKLTPTSCRRRASRDTPSSSLPARSSARGCTWRTPS